MVKTENFIQVQVESAAELRTWLEAHHAQEAAVWLVTFKKVVPTKYVSVSEVLDELLCFGWIDGVRRKLDGERTMQLISPRRAQHWSKTYKDRAARLESEGRMHEAGRQAIQASKESGLWDFLNDVDALIKPPDLLAALRDHPPALQVFDGFPAASQRFVLRWIKLAKTEKTRQKRILQTAVLAAKGERVPGS